MGFEDLIGPVNRAAASTLGVPATWTPVGSGSPAALRAVFRERHETFDPEVGANVATTFSAAWVHLADLPRLPLEDDGLAIMGKSFLVVGLEPDGQGGAWLVLQLAGAAP